MTPQKRMPLTMAMVGTAVLISVPIALAQDCSPKVSPSALISEGKLVMSTNPTLPPMQFIDSSGELKGMRITLGNEVAKRLCLEPEYIRIEFSAMIPGLQARRWDVINTGIFWTEERAGIMKMIPYESQAISISVAAGNPQDISKPEDLAGKAVGVEIGGFEEAKLKLLAKELSEKGFETIDVRTFDNFATAYQALRAGQTDATVSIDSTAAEYAKRGEFDRAISGLFATPVALAMANDELANAVLEVMNEMVKDGSYKGLLDEYGVLANTGKLSIRGPGN